MSKWRRAKKTDNSQLEIVKQLRSTPGVTVEVNHDDILCGFRGRTFWFEIKSPAVFKKDGTPQKNAIKPSQVKLLETWTGHYKVVSTIEEILAEIGI